MKKTFNLTNDFIFTFAAIALMLLALPFRLFNLNYNSAFNDEAIYIIVGLMGVFERDWWTYNASAWIPGVQYLYPSITAISYSFGGIIGSRFLNVLLSIFTIQLIFLLTANIYRKVNNLKVITLSQIFAGSIAAILVGGSEISHYVARLATYDMPSFMFLFLGLLLLIEYRSVTAGNRYFLASIFLSLSYLAKIITGMYLPFIIYFFYRQAKSVSNKNLQFYKQYFLLPIFLIIGIFTIFSFNSLYEYYSAQQGLTRADLIDIPTMIWEKANLPIIFALIGAAGLFIKKQIKLLFILTGGALLIILFHLLTSRTLSMDKHLFLMIAFLSMIAGIGITNLISPIKNKLILGVSIVLVVLSLAFYWISSYQKLDQYNHQWRDMSVLNTPLQENVEMGDKVLAESGSAVILETYYKNFPPNTSTFDWLEYRGKTGDEAYAMAVRDGYFDLIQLESTKHSKSERNAKISELVKENMETNYHLIFEKEGFMLFKRAY